MTAPTPFKIAVSEDLLSWITDRVKTARLPPGKELPADRAWAYGLATDTAVRLQHYWANEYRWRDVEAQLNKELEMYTLGIPHEDEDLTIHFVHHHSSSPNAIPLLFLHGWPGNFLEVRPIIRELTKPSSPSVQAYHVVAPSLPGYGFSSYPSKPFSLAQMAGTMHKLMLALGYSQYICQGGDWGSILARIIAQNHSEYCVGIHLNMMVAGPPSALRAPLALGRLVLCYATGWWNDFDSKMLKRMKWWSDDEMGYSAIQGTKPLTISYALTDSPFGMMCWIRDKLHHLVDDDFIWKDELIVTWAMVYILNGTAGHAEIYKWSNGEGLKQSMKHFTTMIEKQVAVGVSIFPKDTVYAPRWWAEAAVAKNITFWKAHDKGGHFASIEKPEKLIEDIRSFTASSNIAKKVVNN